MKLVVLDVKNRFANDGTRPLREKAQQDLDDERNGQSVLKLLRIYNNYNINFNSVLENIWKWLLQYYESPSEPETNFVDVAIVQDDCLLELLLVATMLKIQ